MFYPAEITTLEWLPGRSYIRFATISPKYGEQIMTQEESEPLKGTGLQDTSFLKDLIKRSCEGDLQAMEAIYEHFKRSIFNLIYRYTYNSEIAEDLLQDVFLKVFTHLQDIRSEETFVGWLYRIAINTCYSYLRERGSKLHRTISLNEVEGKIEGKAHESGDMIMKKSLDDAIQSLPGKLRTIFLLHDVQGFKHGEIAQMLGCAVGTSKSQLFKARIKIREHLGKTQVL